MEPRRILVLAPHPDDEIVACGIAALRARAAGAQVFVLYLTTGVPVRGVLWPWQRAGHAARLSSRRTEARVAAALFGLEPIGSLDYPSRQLRHHLDAAAGEIGRVIMERGADALWVPAFEGAHQDHDARNPRIDFEPSAMVYAELGRWVSAAAAQRQPALGNAPGDEAGQADREFAGALDQTEGERSLGR